MFFEGDRITYFREMILAPDLAGRKKALKKLLLFQRSDFEGIFKAMDGFPVTIRLLDPPLHEFLPHTTQEIQTLASKMKIQVPVLQEKVSSLKEFNPMMGHRGCRLGITYPEIYDMQVQAIIEAAIKMQIKGVKVFPEIMIPLVGTVEELHILKGNTINLANQLLKKAKVKLKYLVGTMIEVPRAAIVADEIAAEADFFSFGTNDLTQMTFGFSRDDSGNFLKDYIKQGILDKDPFQVLDRRGVGQLVEMGVRLGRKTKKTLKIGICGEHGGEPKSITFCHQVGLDYVSCSPFRVPIARLSAAQAALSANDKKKPVDKKKR